MQVMHVWFLVGGVLAALLFLWWASRRRAARGGWSFPPLTVWRGGQPTVKDGYSGTRADRPSRLAMTRSRLFLAAGGVVLAWEQIVDHCFRPRARVPPPNVAARQFPGTYAPSAALAEWLGPWTCPGCREPRSRVRVNKPIHVHLLPFAGWGAWERKFFTNGYGPQWHNLMQRPRVKVLAGLDRRYLLSAACTILACWDCNDDFNCNRVFRRSPDGGRWELVVLSFEATMHKGRLFQRGEVKDVFPVDDYLAQQFDSIPVMRDVILPALEEILTMKCGLGIGGPYSEDEAWDSD